MKVYLDIVFFLNFMFDLLLLITTAMEQKRYPTKKRLFFASFFGSLSTLFLFLPLTNFTLFFLKIVVSILLIFISFGTRNFVSNLKKLYENSIILGGMIYFIDIQLRYHPDGFLFVQDKTSFSLFFLLIVSPPLFYCYRKGSQQEQKRQLLKHQVTIHYHQKTFEVEGYLDTGNNMKDPYHKRPILILFHKDFHPTIEEAILVPFKTIGHQGILRCIKADAIYLDQKEVNAKKFLIGKSEEDLSLHGTHCIIPEGMLEEEFYD